MAQLRSSRVIPSAVLVLVFTLSGAVLPGALSAQLPSAQPPTTADFEWLAGDWIGRMGGGVIEEAWSPPAAGTLVGMFRWSTDEGVRLYELMTIEDGDAGPVLYLRHFSPGLDAWEEKDAPLVLALDAYGDRRASFLQATDGESTRLTYERKGDGLEITLEKTDGAERSSTTFVYERR